MLLNPEMEAPKLIEVLQEMKNSLDLVNEQLRILTKQVKDDQLLTADGISFIETKHLLMLNYCQCIVYYVLRKAKGLSIQNHPLVRSFVEIKLFIEKIRPIDKKFDYQVQKLLKLADNAKNNNNMDEHTKETGEVNTNDEDPSKFRPNPDMLIPKLNVDGQAEGLYQVPKFTPASMEHDKLPGKRMANKDERGYLRNSKSSPYVKELLDNLENKPEELDNSIVPESIEVSRYVSKRREQARQEEELFSRAPVTKRQRKHEKQIMRNARNGMAALTDGFADVLKMLPQKSNDDTDSLSTMTTTNKGKGFNRRKTKHKH